MHLRSLKLKIILSSAACILVVGIFSNIYLYGYLSGIIAEKADNIDQASLSEVSNRMNQILMRFHSLGYTSANDLEIARVLRYSSLRTLPQKTNGLRAQQKMWGILEASAVRDYITMMVAFNENGVMVQPGNARRQVSQPDIAKILALPLFDEFDASGDLWVLRASKSVFNGENCFAYLSPVYDLAALRDRGWLYIEISPGWITAESISTLDDRFFVIDAKGNCFPQDCDPDILENLPPLGQSKSISLGDKTYKVSTVPLTMGDLVLVQSSDITFLSRDGQPIFFTAFVAIATSLAAAVVLSIVLSNLITRPLRRLKERIEKIGENDLSHDPEIERGSDEIAQTGRMVNQMVGSIKVLIEESEEMHLQRKNSDIALLQSQVNPHFLYNTLDSIHWMATIQKNTGIMTMTRGLSGLLKNLAKGVGDKITLGEELSLVGNYVDIQLIRYMEAFQLEDGIDASFYKYNIVKFTLQPIVENAIFHGIEPKGQLGVISLTAREEGDDLLIVVEDDGVGMTPEELEHLRTNARNSNRSGLSGIGVSNVDNRLKLIYGPTYGLTIESEEGRFTRVIVRIPKEV